MVQLRNRDPLGNQESPPDRRADAAQTDSQLEQGLRFGRVAVHRVTINFPFSHIRRPDFSPRFGAVSLSQGVHSSARLCPLLPP